jgi:long-chain acyl-CoA synthetase
MQHHGAILHNIAGCIDILASDFPPCDGPEAFLSFLPLAHAYEHTAGQFLPIALGAQIHYAEGLERLGANLAEAQPTIMVVVPRLFEVFRGRLLREADRRGPAARRLLDWTVALGSRSAGRRRPRLVDRPLDFLVERLVRRPVRRRFGGRLKAMVSGGAPLNPDVGLFFQALGLSVLQGYGETEAGPVISCNRPAAGIRMDSVGPPLADTDVMIAEDGEILVSGELVMLGYWGDPDATAAALEGGWLHTGDIGRIDADGHLVITDRKKDILVSDKGENVAPQRIEGMLTMQPEIAQAMVYGDRRPHLVGLIVPDAEFRMEWAARHGRDIQASDQDPGFLRAIQGAVDRVNERLAPHERVRRILIAPESFSVENGQLTFTQKLRRHVLRERYGARLDALYG